MTRAAPCTCGADVRPQQDESFMLTHCQQFFNGFPASSTPTWQRARAWHTRRPVRFARIRRVLQAACRTPRRLSTPFLHTTCTSLPRPHSAVRMWWTPPAVSVCHHHANTRRHQRHVLVLAVAYLHIPECSIAIQSRSWGRETRMRTYGRNTRVPAGEIPAYLGEKFPRTYGRSPAYLREK